MGKTLYGRSAVAPPRDRSRESARTRREMTDTGNVCTGSRRPPSQWPTRRRWWSGAPGDGRWTAVADRSVREDNSTFTSRGHRSRTNLACDEGEAERAFARIYGRYWMQIELAIGRPLARNERDRHRRSRCDTFPRSPARPTDQERSLEKTKASPSTPVVHARHVRGESRLAAQKRHSRSKKRFARSVRYIRTSMGFAGAFDPAGRRYESRQLAINWRRARVAPHQSSTVRYQGEEVRAFEAQRARTGRKRSPLGRRFIEGPDARVADGQCPFGSIRTRVVQLGCRLSASTGTTQMGWCSGDWRGHVAADYTGWSCRTRSPRAAACPARMNLKLNPGWTVHREPSGTSGFAREVGRYNGDTFAARRIESVSSRFGHVGSNLHSAFTPYIPAETQLRELTHSRIMGTSGHDFGAASMYLGV